MALITTTTELKKYIAIDDNSNINTMMPFIKKAEQFYIVPLLGKAFYDEVAEAYANSILEEDPVELDEAMAALLPYIQECLTYYAQHLPIPQISVSFGDMGIRQMRADESDAAPKWKEDRLLFESLKAGDLHADALLKFLEDEADADTYSTWFEDEVANTRATGTIVYSTEVASRHIQISNSRRIFLKLQGTIKQLEKRFIHKLIGKEQYDELVSELIAQEALGEALEPHLQELVTRLEAIISKRALFMQLPYMKVALEQDGVWMISESAFMRTKDHVISREDLKALRYELMDGELGYLTDEQDLRQFIEDNIADYPLIAASTAYTVQPDPGPTWKKQPDPDPDSKWFAV